MIDEDIAKSLLYVKEWCIQLNECFCRGHGLETFSGFASRLMFRSFCEQWP